MPYTMEFYYNGKDKDDCIDVNVYSFSCVGQLSPSALVFTLDGREPNDEDNEMPVKNVWLTVPVELLKPAEATAVDAK